MEDSPVVVGAHWDLLIRRDQRELEEEILRLLRKENRLSISLIWRRTRCHLWEIDAALRKLKERGLVIELDMPR